MKRLNWKLIGIIALGSVTYGIGMSFSQEIQIRWVRYMVAAFGGAVFGGMQKGYCVVARILKLNAGGEGVQKSLSRAFQSAHVNFLIGSGASCPAIPVAGDMEKDIATLLEASEDVAAMQKMYQYLESIQVPTNKLVGGDEDEEITKTLLQYRRFIGIIESVLCKRSTNILPKQATIFTTNYDLFMEKAATYYPSLRLNDGFNRVPCLNNRIEYSSSTFFNTTSNIGNLFDYKVELPCVNLLKLHGSFSWEKDRDSILFRVAKKDLPTSCPDLDDINRLIGGYAVVLPMATKLRTTLMDQTYYELLRIYANELDKENVLLVSFGFSFYDEHILQITRRALKNPTLKLIVFAFNEESAISHADKFERYSNVDVVTSPEAEINFSIFNDTLDFFSIETGEVE